MAHNVNPGSSARNDWFNMVSLWFCWIILGPIQLLGVDPCPAARNDTCRLGQALRDARLSMPGVVWLAQEMDGGFHCDTVENHGKPMKTHDL